MPVAGTEESPKTSDIPIAEYRSLLSKFLIRLCVTVTLGVIFLVLGELFSFRRHPPNARDIMMGPVRIQLSSATASEREYWRQYEAADTFTYQPYVLWRRKPFQGSMISVSEDGIRRTLHTKCDDRSFTIWMFGDSTLWGSGATDDQTIPSFLAGEFEREGRNVCVVNYGEGGWANTQEVIELIEKLKHTARKPNVVIFYDGGTEAFTAYQSRQADMPTNYSSFKNYLDGWSAEQKPGFAYLQKTNTHRYLEEMAQKLTRHGKNTSAMTDDEVEALAGNILQNYQQNMDIVGLLAQHFGFRAIFTWYPVLVVGHKQLTPDEQKAELLQEQNLPGVTRVYRAAYGLCEQAHLQNLYYLGDLFDDQKRSLFEGIAHLKPEGNRIVADRLFQILEDPSRRPRNSSGSSQLGHRQHVRGKPV